MEKKHVFMKSLAFFLSLLMIFTVLPMDVLAAEYQSITNETDSASAEAGNAALGIHEIPELREESVKQFRLEDGSYTAVLYDVPVHYEDENGTWQDIDNTLVASGNEYSTSNARVKFAKKITGNESLFVLHENNRRITVSLNGALKKVQGQVTNTETEFDADATELQKMMTLDRLSSRILYSDILNGVDLEYVVESNYIKENIIVKQSADAYSYTFTIDLNNLDARMAADGSVEIYDPDTEEIAYTMPAPVVYDANGVVAPADKAYFTLTQSGNMQYELTVTADSAWMNAADRAYPVVVDPALYGGRDSSVTDTFVDSTAPTSSYTSSTNLYAGKTTKAYWKTSVLPTLPASAYVTDAQFIMRASSASGTATYLGVYTVTAAWPTNMTYNTAAAYGSTYHDFNNITAVGQYTWRITDLVKSWYNGTANNGLVIAPISGYSAGADIKFYSNDYSASSIRPMLCVSYVDMKGVEDYWNFVSQSVGRAGSASVNTATGQLTLALPTLSTTDSLMPYTASLVYNSALANDDFNYLFASVPYKYPIAGYGFKWSMNETIVEKTYTDASANTSTYYIWSDADGTEHYFVPYLNSDGEVEYYEDEDGYMLRLEETSTAYTITSTDHTVRTFTRSASDTTYRKAGGVLNSITDSNGNKIGFSFDSTGYGRVTAITLTPAGGSTITSLQIAYNSNGHPSYILNPSSQEAMVFYYTSNDGEYTDDASGYGNLTRIEYAHQNNGTSTTNWNNYVAGSSVLSIDVDAEATYTYDSAGRMTRIRDELSDYEVRYTYNTSGQVTAIREYAGTGTAGQKITLSYGTGYTDIRTSGTNDVHADDGTEDEDDIITRYQFDTRGRATGAYSTDMNRTIIYGASNGQYEATSDNVKLNNHVKSSSVISSTAANYLLNGGFESTTGWQTAGEASWNTSTPYEGIRAAELSADSDLSEVYQYVHLPVGEYTLSMFYKTMQASNQELYLKISHLNGTVLKSEQMPLNQYNASQGYTYGSTSFTVESGGNYKISIVQEMADPGTNTTQIDNVMLERSLGSGTYSMVNFGSFENTVINASGTATASVADYWTSVDGSAVETVYDVTPFRNVLKLPGQLNIANSATQTLALSTNNTWLQNKIIRVSGFGRATSLMAKATSAFGLQLTVTYTDGTTATQFFPFTSDTGNWQFTGGTYTVESKAVRFIDISCVYAYQGGTAYFDDIIVAVENEATTTVNSYYPETGLPHYTKSGSSVVWYEYNDDRDLTRQITNDGMAVYQYDANHNVTRMDYYTYNVDWDYTAETYSGTGISSDNAWFKYETSYTYNAYGLPTATSTVSADGTITSSTTYDTGSTSRTFGAVLTETDSLGRVTRYFYDAKNGDLKAVINPDETGLEYTYDNLGNLELVEPAVISGTSYTNVTDSASATYNYNAQNRLASIVTESTTYNFTYDTFGNSKSIKAGNNTLASYTYNNYNGKLATMTYGNGTKVEYVYDELDRVAEVWYTENGGSKTKAYSYEYDANGNLYRFNDHTAGRVHVYKYDLNGNMLMAVEYAENDFYNKFSTHVSYDTENRPTYVYYGFDYADPRGGNDANFDYSYDYNDDSTLKKVTIRQNESTVLTITPTYDALSRVTTQTNKVGSATNTINYQFKANGSSTSAQVSQMTSTVGSTTTTYKYTYDENGNITEIANASGVIQNKYWYDDLGQLRREDNRATGRTYLFNYDNAGNIQYRKTYAFTTAGTATSVSTTLYSTDNYTYGNANWGDLLTAYKGTAISYDTIGNPINYYNGYEFTWSKGRQLASATNGTNTLSFAYNADGIRTSKTVNGVKHTYLLSGSTIMGEYWQARDATLNRYVQYLVLYLYDNAGSPVGMMYRNSTMASDTYDYFLFEKNLQGDIVAVYNASGTKLLSYTYDAWGNCTVTGSTTTGAQYNPFRYRGYYYDSEIGLYYLNSRYYDANTGRFINADVLVSTGQGVLGYNMYAYCNNRPTMAVDHSGQYSTSNWQFSNGKVYDLGNGWKARFDVGKVGNQSHVHIYNGHGKSWAMNLDGSMSHEGNNSSGNPPTKPLKKLKELTGFDYKTIRDDYLKKCDTLVAFSGLNPIYHYEDDTISYDGEYYYPGNPRYDAQSYATRTTVLNSIGLCPVIGSVGMIPSRISFDVFNMARTVIYAQ